ncbi:MAG: hypothetical protein QM530_06275 [Phycisphaerales bacterium]|nr:hypothetical protein [Phycisphaerales bacterium]
MRNRLFLLLSILLLSSFGRLRAQQIKGVVQERNEKAPLVAVQLVNIHNNNTAFSDSQGNFSISAAKGELIELRCAGYRTMRFRLSQGNIPPFFKIYLDKLVLLNTDKYASSNLSPYQIDSITTHKLYSSALDYPRMTPMQQIESPFSALSKNNRMKWAFQDSYAQFEREKFVDYTFNENLVKELTGLEGKDVQNFMKRYRPSYEALRNMSLYDYYNYIKQSAIRFIRQGKPTAPRNSG